MPTHNHSDEKHGQGWQQENIVEIDAQQLTSLTEYICNPRSRCRYPLLALRLLIHVICQIDGHGRMYISARKLSQKMDVHYDSLTKCLKYLREIGAIRVEYKSHI